MVTAQGGDTTAFDDRSRLPAARLRYPVLAESDGYIARLDALSIARASMALGAGRERKGDSIDLTVGVLLERKIGERVSRGESLAVVHANDERRLARASEMLRAAIDVSATPVSPPPLILDRLTGSTAAPRAPA
jgi:pyrimidine-nucleoside phosphorylase